MDLTSSIVALGAAGVGGEDFWMSFHWNPSGDIVRFQRVMTNDDGDVFIAGQGEQADGLSLPNNHKPAVHKLDGTDGSALWYRFISQQRTYANSYYFDVSPTSQGDVILTGTRPYVGSGQDQGNGGAVVTKYNSSGSNQWIRYSPATGSSTSYSLYSCCRAPSTGTTYAVGVGHNLRAGALLEQWQSNGNLGFAYLYRSTAGNITVAPNNNSKCVALGNTDNYIYIACKYNNHAAVLQIQSNYTFKNNTWLDSPSGELGPKGLALDSDDNQYVVTGNEPGKFFLFKITRSNQQIAWQKNIDNAADQYYMGSVAVSGDKVYVAAAKQFTGDPGKSLVVTAFNTSDGSFYKACKIKLTHSNGNPDIRPFDIHATDTAIYVTGFTRTSGNGWGGGVYKLPPDFSGTGTYNATNIGNIEYSTWTPTISTSSQSENSSSTGIERVTMSHNDQSSSYTAYNVSFTSSQVEIS